MIELCFDKLIEKYFEEGKIPKMPDSPKQRIEFIRKYFSKEKAIQETIPVYIFFKRVPELEKKREGEFRKNVNLKVIPQKGRAVDVNLEKLKEYTELLERFISEVKHLLSK